MTKQEKLKTYQDIRKQIDNLEKGQVIDFGRGSYQESMAGVFVERDDVNHDRKVFFVNDYIMTNISEISSIVYKAIQ